MKDRQKGAGQQKNIGRRLKTQLIIAFMVLISMLLIGVVCFTYKKVEKVVQDQSSAITHQYFVQNEYSILAFTEELDKLLKLMIVQSGLGEYLNSGWKSEFDTIVQLNEIFDYTSALMISYDYIESIYYYGNNGVALGVLPRNNQLVQAPDVNQPYYTSEIHQEVQKDPWSTHWFGNFSLKDFMLSSDTRRDIDTTPYITAVRSINVMGKSEAAVVLNIKQSVIADLFTKADINRERKSYLVDREGRIIVDASEANIGTYADIPLDELQDQSKEYIMKGDVQINFYHIEDLGWTLISEIPKKILYEDIESLRQWFVISVIGGIAAAFALSMYWMYRLTRPLDQLRMTMKRMEEGELGLELEDVSKNELGMLGRQFNQMSLSIRDLVHQIQDMESEKRVLEKEALQSQINPHFLFNTLTNIKYMAMLVKSDSIVECITALGSLLQPIYKSENEFWTVARELEYIGNYIKIMNYRFGGGIQVHYDIPEELEEKYVLQFILQPLIENTISHGFAASEGRGNIEIRIRQSDNMLQIFVEDNGSGINGAEIDRLNEILKTADQQEGLYKKSVGLVNVHRRLKVYFGGDYGLKLNSVFGEKTCVSLSMPADVTQAVKT